MKYFELLYLVAAMFLGGVMVRGYGQQPAWQSYLLMGGMVIFSFLFSFRRTQRLRAKQKDKDKTHP